ncbi:hypothetical protein CcaCcLH18_07837 [Colletotrichum camelliae]|nr:hypothetical protein CcaCcLH18_07837 [Colletotrichum camelliae]
MHRLFFVPYWPRDYPMGIASLEHTIWMMDPVGAFVPAAQMTDGGYQARSRAFSGLDILTGLPPAATDGIQAGVTTKHQGTPMPTKANARTLLKVAVVGGYRGWALG